MNGFDEGFDPDFVGLMRRHNAGDTPTYDEFFSAMVRMGKQRASYHVVLFGESMPPALLAQLLPSAWSGSEWPEPLGQRSWVRLFRHAGFVAETKEGGRWPDGVPLPWGTAGPPMAPLTIYRGVSPGARIKGMSWTLDRERAGWFAKRLEVLYGPGTVYVADVAPTGVLAYFAKEQEVVVDPRALRKPRPV
jgi:hypothetical protein